MGSMGTPVNWRCPNPPLQDSVFQMFKLHGKVAVITGGSGDIGSEIARGLAEAGADIALWYHNSKAALDLAAAVEKGL
jgi:sorbose reductase